MYNNENDLIDVLKKSANIIIYGASARAFVVVDRIRFHGLRANIFVAVTDTKGELNSVIDLPVENIADLRHLAPTTTVFIATTEKWHDEIEAHTRNLGFQNIIRMSSELFADMAFRYDVFHTAQSIKLADRNNELQLFWHYRNNNTLRLHELKTKISSGKKKRVKVLFLLTSAAKFQYESVYKALERKELFDCIIFFFDEYYIARNYYYRRKNNFAAELKDLRLLYEKLEAQGYNVIWGYDEDGEAVSIEEQFPDIIIYNTYKIGEAFWGNNTFDAEHSYYRLFTNYLSCVIPYGIEVANLFEYQFNHHCLLPAWIRFFSNKPAFRLCVNSSVTKGVNAVLSGHPMLDAYKTDSLFVTPEKINNGNKTVIYAPHWSINDWYKTATFHLHYNYFLQLVKNHPEINFVFKPHPRLEYEIDVRRGEAGIPSFSEWEDFCAEWENSPNGIIVTDSNFIELFKISDCLITDSYSFIPAWLPTEKPCIIPVAPDGYKNMYRQYYDHIRPIIDSYYVCKTEAEIEETFNKVVIRGDDCMFEERKKQERAFIYNLGHAGEFIADYIERQLLD